MGQANKGRDSAAGIGRADWSAVIVEMRAILVGCARARHTITYSELTRQLTTARVHYHSPWLTRLLEALGREEAAAQRPILAALVVTKQTGMPGGGYFEMTARDSLPAEDLAAIWQADVQAVYEYWKEEA
jgi:hypothetical protein